MTRIERRKKELEADGFVAFYLSESEKAGLVAVHRSWRFVFEQTSKNERRAMRRELEAGMRMKKLGYEALYDRRRRNIRGGDVDVVFNGLDTEVKTPQRFTVRKFEDMIRDKPEQSNYYVIHLKERVSKEDFTFALRRLRRWNRRHPEKTVWILHDPPGSPELMLEKVL